MVVVILVMWMSSNETMSFWLAATAALQYNVLNTTRTSQEPSHNWLLEVYQTSQTSSLLDFRAWHMYRQ
jgi:hypothetical protein